MCESPLQISSVPWNTRVTHAREQIGVVAQDTPLFARTILENIVYGLDEGSWTMDDVEHAAKQACALDFINEVCFLSTVTFETNSANDFDLPPSYINI